MTLVKPRFSNFEEYLSLEPSALLEGRCEYWDGELIPVMSESIDNIGIANYLFVLLINLGIPIRLLCPHACEVEVPGEPRTRYPDLTLLAEEHLSLLKKKATITRQMPPPRLLVEVVSPGNESSKNYRRDYEEKSAQYAAIGVFEYWIVDPDRQVVSVGVLISGEYRFECFANDQAILSQTFPSLELTALQLLEAKK